MVLKRITKYFLQWRKRKLESQIDFDYFDSKLSSKIDAITIKLEGL